MNTTTTTKPKKRVSSRTKALRRAERAFAKEAKRLAREATARQPEKVRKALSANRVMDRLAAGMYRDDPHFKDCPYCRAAPVGEAHLERCRNKALKPILEARAKGITILDYVAEGVPDEEEDEDDRP